MPVVVSDGEEAVKHAASYYLTEEANEKRLDALARRIAEDAAICGDMQTFLPDSDYWKLPASMQRRVRDLL